MLHQEDFIRWRCIISIPTISFSRLLSQLRSVVSVTLEPCKIGFLSISFYPLNYIRQHCYKKDHK